MSRVEQEQQLNTFLSSVEKRALRMAEIATRNRDDALKLIQESMFASLGAAMAAIMLIWMMPQQKSPSPYLIMPAGNMPVKAHILYFSFALLICTALCTPSHAEEPTADVEASEIELFEFIADWETDDGQWLEPSEFEKKTVNDKNNGDFHMTTTQEGHYDH